MIDRTSDRWAEPSLIWTLLTVVGRATTWFTAAEVLPANRRLPRKRP